MLKRSRKQLVVMVSCLATSAGQAMAAATVTGIPICEGLKIVTAVEDSAGDYESIKTIAAASPESIFVKYSSEVYDSDMLSSTFGETKKSTVARLVTSSDLDNAELYVQRFIPGIAELIPGSTALGISRAQYEQFDNTGVGKLTISTLFIGNVSVDRAVRPNVYDYAISGEFRLASREPYRVLVNNTPIDLPSLVLEGDFVGAESEFRILADPENPLTLAFRIGIDAVKPAVPEQVELCRMITGEESMPKVAMCAQLEGGDSEVLNVVQISYDCKSSDPEEMDLDGSDAPAVDLSTEEQSVRALELSTALAAAAPVPVYDILFSFDSAELRHESQAPIAAIAEVLASNAEWKLLIVGHTDSVADDAYNLALSARRAEAVREALITVHGVSADRLEAAGRGETEPRDNNETVAGRARNRRVELTRH